jgi:hypothetical protein
VTETPTQAPAAPPGPPRRNSLHLTTRDMVVSMIVIVAVVGVYLLLVPRPNSVPTRTIDVASAASGASAQLGFTPSYPKSALGDGWNATVASVQVDTDNLPTWHVDYVTPTGHYVGIQETRNATPDWESRQVTDGRVQGSVEIAGHSWLIRSRTDRGVTSYVLRRPPLTTVVTGTATPEEMAQFTAAVVPPAAEPTAAAGAQPSASAQP